MARKSGKRQNSSSYAVNVQAGQVVMRGRPIEIVAKAAISADGQRGVAVAGQRVRVEASDDGRTIRVDTGELPVGAHRLKIDEVLTKRSGERLTDADIGFIIVDTAAPVPEDVAIQHAVRLRIGELTVDRIPMDGKGEGKFIDVFKTVSRASQKPAQLAYDEHGKVVDVDSELAALAKRRHDRYGRIHPALYEVIRKQKAQEPVDVAVWLKTPAVALEEKPVRFVRQRPASEEKEREQWKALTYRFRDEARKYDLEPKRIDRTAPVVYGVMPAAMVAKLAEHPDVAGIFLHEPEGIDDLGNSLAIANSDDVHTAGTTGKGVNVAVYERGPDDTSELAITDVFDSTPDTSDHSRHTHAIIKNVERSAPHGHAPDCNLHSANSYDLDAIEWAAEDANCTVISQSFHRSSEPTDSGLSYDDVYKDNLALHWPYPTICEAAGNGADSEFVNHKGFNRLTVGNHNDSASAMASDSVFRNPSTSHGDRELPEIAANGTSVTTVDLTKGGTSMAAPAVAGGVALIQQTHSTLRSWPEACRAILLASAWRNPAGGTWHDDLVSGVDAADGAGALDSAAAVQIARNRRSPNGAGAQRGWDAGTLSTASAGTFVYNITVPRTLLFPRVKVALAWDSKITEFDLFGLSLLISSRLTVDLDLQVFDSTGSLVASSASWDNSYEIVEFNATRGATYKIRIRRWSGTDSVWFGIAWTTRGLNLVLDSVPVTFGRR